MAQTAPAQMMMFPESRPLADRFGASFLQSVPQLPGVYVMTGHLPPRGSEPRVLYVGKSIDLRRRLADYFRIQSDSRSRKAARLVHWVDSITWETCRDEETALLRENELLRLHRPRFNRVNVWPHSYVFLCWSWCPPDLVLFCSTRPGVSGFCHGAFKGAEAIRALARFVACLACPGVTSQDLPMGMFSRTRHRWSFHLGHLTPREQEASVTELKSFLNGESDELLSRLPPSAGAGDFESKWRQMDHDQLTDFFRRGPRRLRDLRIGYGVRQSWVGKEELDDLLVMNTARSRESLAS